MQQVKLIVYSQLYKAALKTTLKVPYIYIKILNVLKVNVNLCGNMRFWYDGYFILWMYENDWAATWKYHVAMHYEMTQISNSRQHSQIRVFAVCTEKAWDISYPLRAQRRLWSDWADAQADLSLRWAHTQLAGFLMLWLTFVSYYKQIYWVLHEFWLFRSKKTLVAWTTTTN